MKEDIETFNDKGQWHGYQEWYNRGKVFYRGNHKFGWIIYYHENHYSKQTSFFIK